MKKLDFGFKIVASLLAFAAFLMILTNHQGIAQNLLLGMFVDLIAIFVLGTINNVKK